MPNIRLLPHGSGKVTAMTVNGRVYNCALGATITDGKPDLMKMLRIGHEHAAAIPLTKRAAYERQLFGAQGSRRCRSRHNSDQRQSP